jgi:hypothetical protein
VRRRAGWIPIIELGLAGYFLFTLIYSLTMENYLTTPFLLLFLMGYAYMGTMSLFQTPLRRLANALPALLRRAPWNMPRNSLVNTVRNCCCPCRAPRATLTSFPSCQQTRCHLTEALCYTLISEGVLMQPRFEHRAILALIAGGHPGGALAAGAWEREPLSAFHERRARLIRETGGDGVVVLYGYGEADVAASVTSFRQNEEFYYLTGWNEPEAIMLLAPKAHAHGATAELEKKSSTSRRTIARKRNGRGRSWRRRTQRLVPARDFLWFATSRNSTPTSRRRSKGFPKIYTELTPQSESGEDCFQAEIVSKLRDKAPQASIVDIRADHRAHARGEESGRNRPDSQGRGRIAGSALCRHEGGEAGRLGIRDCRTDEV